MSNSSGESIDDYSEFKGTFINDYFIIDNIGKGAYGTIWVCYSKKQQEFKAIKICPIIYDIEEEVAYKEIQIIESLKIPQIIQIYDYFKYTRNDDDFICIVMQLLGCSLYDLIKQNKNGLPIEFINNIVQQLIGIMKSLHEQQIIHTDIKPDNILLAGYSDKILNILSEFKKSKLYEALKNGKSIKNLKKTYKKQKEIINQSDFYEVSRSLLIDDTKEDIIYNDINKYIKNPMIYLCDFGSCIKENENNSEEIIQTRYYRAPEVLLGLPYDYHCDYWSIGCMIYEMLTGELLFDPNHTTRYSTDKEQLRMIIEKIGNIPEEMKQESPKKLIFFRGNGLLKGIREMKKKLISDKITDKNNVIELMFKLLNINPKLRCLF